VDWLVSETAKEFVKCVCFGESKKFTRIRSRLVVSSAQTLQWRTWKRRDPLHSSRQV
jgi:hypothetical protein